jgi:L,D-transpeptidase YcbB
VNIPVIVIFLFTLAFNWQQPAAVKTGPSRQYQRLLAAHAAYTAIAASQAWAAIPGELCLRPGDTNLHIPKLRHNLLLTGDLRLPGVNPGLLLDDSLAAALIRFQRRHGLPPDGTAGPLTLAALNVSPEQRLRQIELNLERWQQIPADAYPLVLVNIADFTLQLLDTAQKEVWKTRVIVGQPAQPYQTALISSKINYLVLQPTWNIPQSIIRHEIIPMLRRDPAYLARNHMILYRVRGNRREVISPYSVNWNQALPVHQQYQIIQQAGRQNALGKIKFIFPNPFDQYLHDTPVKSLFSHPIRTYSHGCVRVQNPQILAAYLLSGNWAQPLKVRELPRSTTANKIISLPVPVHIQIGYFTAWVDESGVLQFRPDIYRLDRKSNRLPAAALRPKPAHPGAKPRAKWPAPGQYTAFAVAPRKASTLIYPGNLSPRPTRPRAAGAGPESFPRD